MTNDREQTTALTALSDLYRRGDGTMRQCNRAPDDLCLRMGCYRDGCHRANEILKTAKEAPDAR